MNPSFKSNGVTMFKGDSRELLRQLPDESVHCCVTSPPYWGLRDYGVGGQIGLESTPYEYIATMRMLFAEVRRVLRADGTLWLNMGDSYCSPNGRSAGNTYDSSTLPIAPGTDVARNAGISRKWSDGMKPKDLCGIPWMLAFALREDGWYLRQDIIWAKPNPMPESVTDRCTKSHEYIFLLSKSERYYYNAEAIKEDSVTNDIRRPYGSQGAWDMDGRPDEQRHGGEPRSFKGSSFTDERDVLLHPTVSRKPRKTKVPGGWDTGDVAHGTIHRNGRTSAGYVDTDLGEKRNKRSVWEISTTPFPEAHFATFPEDLIKPCILAGCPEGGTVLDPFGGAGTTGLVARKLHCKAILLELNQEYIDISAKRLSQEVLQF